MCGIWIYFLNNSNKKLDLEELFSKFNNINGRGPDNINFTYYKNKFITGFHRLSIMDVSINGNQPFIYNHNEITYICICNGEIYNSSILKEDILSSSLDYTFISKSDCEVLIPLYILHNVNMIKKLKGVFAFTIVAINNKGNYNAFVCRDRIGVRPLFIGKNNTGEVGFCSEIKGLIDIFDSIEVFTPGTYMLCDNNENWFKYFYYNFEYKINEEISNHRTW